MKRDLTRRENEEGNSRRSKHPKAQKQQRECYVWGMVNSPLWLQHKAEGVTWKDPTVG